MNATATIVLAAMTAVTPSLALAASDHERQAIQMLSPVVQIGDFCSGVVVRSETDPETGKNETDVLTAKHCIELSGIPKGIDYDVKFPVYQDHVVVEERTFKAQPETDYAHDLAVLRLLSDDFKTDQVAIVQPTDGTIWEGEDLWSVGYSFGLPRSVVRGEYAGTIKVDVSGDGKVLPYTRATFLGDGGHSGGGTFHLNEKTGNYELVGINSASVRGSSLSLVVPVAAINDFLIREKIFPDPDAESTPTSR